MGLELGVMDHRGFIAEESMLHTPPVDPQAYIVAASVEYSVDLQEPAKGVVEDSREVSVDVVEWTSSAPEIKPVQKIGDVGWKEREKGWDDTETRS
jgi:hypothetical protein